MIDNGWLAPFLVGFFGSTHCLTMCGGIAAGLGSATSSKRSRLPYLLLFQFGRVASYAVAGFLIGAFAWSVAAISAMPAWLPRLLVGVFMILCGVWLAVRRGPMQWLGHWGASLWARLGPLAQKLLPADRWWKASVLGVLWGWLPCGLVYSMLTGAAGKVNPIDGAVWMAMFGLGTMPAMTAMAWGGSWLESLRGSAALRWIAAAAVVAMGVWTIVYSGVLPSPGHHH
ncbi:MAG: membrane protein [Lysobacteraceae bacterium]|nr:MAG: membrane protein [Xanthomonadaceae bacterium]